MAKFVVTTQARVTRRYLVEAESAHEVFWGWGDPDKVRVIDEDDPQEGDEEIPSWGVAPFEPKPAQSPRA